jgi:hypothetical protein
MASLESSGTASNEMDRCAVTGNLIGETNLYYGPMGSEEKIPLLHVEGIPFGFALRGLG